MIDRHVSREVCPLNLHLAVVDVVKMDAATPLPAGVQNAFGIAGIGKRGPPRAVECRDLRELRKIHALARDGRYQPIRFRLGQHHVAGQVSAGISGAVSEIVALSIDPLPAIRGGLMQANRSAAEMDDGFPIRQRWGGGLINGNHSHFPRPMNVHGLGRRRGGCSGRGRR